MPAPLLHTKTAAARLLGVSVQKVETMIERGQLKHVLTGRTWMVTEESIRLHLAGASNPEPVRSKSVYELMKEFRASLHV